MEMINPTLIYVIISLLTIMTLLMSFFIWQQNRLSGKMENWISKVVDIEKELTLQITDLDKKDHSIISDHRVLCQKHEDQISAIISKSEENYNGIYKARKDITEVRSYIENKLREFEIMINHIKT